MKEYIQISVCLAVRPSGEVFQRDTRKIHGGDSFRLNTDEQTSENAHFTYLRPTVYHSYLSKTFKKDIITSNDKIRIQTVDQNISVVIT